jgi:hypothetical protein
MKRTVRTTVAGIMLAAGVVNAEVVPLSAWRSMNVSLLLDVPGNDYVARFDQFEQPAQSALAAMNRGIYVNNDGMITQQSLTSQSSSLNDSYKLVDARLFGSLVPGQWSRGQNINGQNGLLNELYFAARVTRPTVADLAARAYGTINGGVSMTANVNVYRNGEQVFTFNVTPPSEFNTFDVTDGLTFNLVPGNYEFFANISGTGRGGVGNEGAMRAGDMTLTLGVTTAIPSPAGVFALLGAGAYTILRRRR